MPLEYARQDQLGEWSGTGLHHAPDRTETHVFLDRVVYVVALVGPLSNIPQILKIWGSHKSAHAVSLETWVLFMVMSAIWLVYGIAHREMPLIISNSLWMVCEMVIMVGAFLFDTDLL